MKTILYYKTEFDQARKHNLPNVVNVEELATSYNQSSDTRLYRIASSIFSEADLIEKFSWTRYPGEFINKIEAHLLLKELQPDREVPDMMNPEGPAVQFSTGLLTLEEAKKVKESLIDLKTAQLISAGFEYDGHTFSLSPSARENWDDIWRNSSDISMYPQDPIPVSAQDIPEYLLAKEDVMAFHLVAHDKVKSELDAGRDLNKLVDACTEIEQLISDVVDSR